MTVSLYVLHIAPVSDTPSRQLCVSAGVGTPTGSKDAMKQRTCNLPGKHRLVRTTRGVLQEDHDRRSKIMGSNATVTATELRVVTALVD